jgi:hypothetical protein
VQAQQNLVPNPSFEVIDTPCVYNGGIVWDKSHMVGWWQALNSVDYFTDTSIICSKPFDFAVPENVITYNLNAVQGNNYIGVCTYALMGYNWREQLECQLIQPLKQGHFYRVEFYTAFQSYYRYGNNKPLIASTNFGIKFTNKRYRDCANSNVTDTLPSLTLKPDIQPQSIITDTTWVKVSGVFRADSNYSFLTLGSFGLDSSLVDTALIHIGCTCNPNVWVNGYFFGYYLIDQVSVSEMDTVISANSSISAINFTAKLTNDILYINANKNVCKIQIISLSGKCVGNFESNNYTDQFDLSKYVSSPGLYMVRVYNSNSTTTLKYINYE